MRLLLDTNVLLWAAENTQIIPDAARLAMMDANNSVFISSITMWEICQKMMTGKLALSITTQELARLSRERFDAQFISFEAADCYHLKALPAVHKDPFDRMLICQAIQNNLTFVTSDALIRQYPIKTLWD